MRLLLVSILAVLPLTGYADQHTPPAVLAPLTSANDEQPVYRGQSGARQSDTFAGLEELLSAPLPIAGGASHVEIDPKLTANPDIPEPEQGIAPPVVAPSNTNTVAGGVPVQEETPPPDLRGVDPMGYGALLIATVCTTIGLIWMVFVAFDYRQRWMYALTVRNDRYAGCGAYDIESEDLYGSPALNYDYPLHQRAV